MPKRTQRDLALSAQRFTILTFDGKLIGEKHAERCMRHAGALDNVVANLKRAVDGLTEALSYTDEFTGERHEVTREQAIELLTPWAREMDDFLFADRVLLKLFEDEEWEPDDKKRREVLMRVRGCSAGALQKAIERARERRDTSTVATDD